MESSTGYLILRRRPLDADTLAEHARRFGAEGGLDAYTARLKVLGQGLTSLRSGKAAELETSRRLALRLGYECFIATENPPRQEANLVRRLRITDERLGFETRNGVFYLPRGGQALLAIGDMSKRLTSKFTSRAQLNPGQPASLTPQEQYKTILTARPLLDVYLFDADGRPNLDEAPLRFEPGKFDAEGLTGDAILGTPQLIDRLVRTIKGYCATLHSDLDFGLSALPGIAFEGSDTPQAYETNALAFCAYGWYLRRLVWARLENGTRADFVTGNETPEAEEAAPISQTALPFGYDPASYKPKAPLPPPPAAQHAAAGTPFGGIAAHRGSKTFFLSLVFLTMCFVGLVMADKGFPQLLTLVTYRGIFFGLVAAFCFMQGFKSLGIKRLIENTPTAKARSLAAGYVELHGTAERAYNLLSPVSGLACVYYRARRYRKQHSKNGDTWVLESETHCGDVPFYLRDETGRILVKPQGAQILPTLSETYMNDDDGGGGILGPLLHGGSYKTIEEVIPELSTLCVWGNAVPTRQTETPWRRRLAERLKGLKQDRSRLMRYDADGNGVIDEAEWQTAVDDAEKETGAELLKEQNTERAENDLCLEAPTDKSLPYIISGKDERHTSHGYAWTTAFSFAAALAFLVAALWLFDYTATHDIGARINTTFNR